MGQEQGMGEEVLARERYDRALRDLEAAQTEAAAAGTTLTAIVTQAVPDITIEVISGSISHEGGQYSEGDRLTLSGPTAIAIIQLGAARPVEEG